MLDAYAVRKAIPRIVLAVIGINLSIYLCVAAVDVTNVVGGGIARLLVGPFADADATVFDVPTDPANTIVAGVGTYLAVGPLTAALNSMLYTVAFGGITGILSALGSLLFLLIPLGLLALAIVITVVIRQALLFFLIVVSPVAIACYVLPGTEKYFKAWGDLFVKTLLVYPIIALMFALSDVFGSIIFTSNTGGLTGVAKIVAGIVVIYAPLFLIPFAFKFAGGAMSRIAGAATGVGDRMAKSGFVKERVDYKKQMLKDDMLRGRAEAYRRANASASRGGVRGFAAGRMAKNLSGYKTDILDREAELKARLDEATAKTANSGDDSLIRAYTVNKKTADEARANKTGEGKLWRIGEDGQMQYSTAGGKWVSETDVDEAQRKYGKRNTTQLSTSMAYEMKKAATQEQQDNLVRSFGETAEEWGMSSSQAQGAWIGAGFANQDQNLQWKHASWQGTTDAAGNTKFSMNTGGTKLIEEMDEKKGSYEAGRQNADTWSTMSDTVVEAHQGKAAAEYSISQLRALPSRTKEQDNQLAKQIEIRDKHNDTLHRASRIVDSIRTEHEELGADGKPTGSGRKVTSIGAGASGRTKEEMTAFAQITDQFAGKYQGPEGFFDPNDPNKLPKPADRPQAPAEQSLDDRQQERKDRTN